MVKRLPAMQETGFDPQVWKIPWRRKWQLTPVLSPGKLHRQRSLVSYSPWGHKKPDTTEQFHFGIIVQFLSIFVVQLLSHVWLPDPMDCRMQGLPVPYCLLEFAQVHVHWISNAINHLILCHPLFFFWAFKYLLLLFCDPWMIWKVLLFSKCMRISCYTFTIDFSSEGLWAEGTGVDYNHFTSYCLQRSSGGPSAFPMWLMFLLHCAVVLSTSSVLCFHGGISRVGFFLFILLWSQCASWG